jgi:hypothetical protein
MQAPQGHWLPLPAPVLARIPPLAPMRIVAQILPLARVLLPALAQSRTYRRKPALRAVATPVRRTRRAAEQWE